MESYFDSWVFFYNEEPKQNIEPFITVFKSKPIMGVILELQTINPELLKVEVENE